MTVRPRPHDRALLSKTGEQSVRWRTSSFCWQNNEHNACSLIARKRRTLLAPWSIMSLPDTQSSIRKQGTGYHYDCWRVHPDAGRPVTPCEVSKQISKLRGRKARCPDGVAPGVIKLLPVQWITLITSLFNSVFYVAQTRCHGQQLSFLSFFKGESRSHVNRRNDIAQAGSQAPGGCVELMQHYGY